MKSTEIIKTDYFRERRIDVVVIDGVEYFIVDQISRALEYKSPLTLYRNINHRWRDEFKDDELMYLFKPQYMQFADIVYSMDTRAVDRYGYMMLVSEEGLYTILLSSKAILAKEFRTWLKREVLPSIRKKGYYVSERVDPEQLKLELMDRKVELERAKTNRLYLASDLLKELEKSETTDQRWISHSRMLLVADITGQRIDFEMEINLSDFLKERGHKANESELISFGREVAKLYRKVRGKEPLKTKKQLKTGIRDVNYYTVDDIPLIEKAYDQWTIKPQVCVSSGDEYKLVDYM